MFNRKKKKTDCETPEYRRSTPPPPPTSGSNAVKTNPPNVGSSVQHPKQPCTYETPCGWCTKWDKQCDHKPYKRGLRVQINPVDDYIGDDWKETITNKMCESDEDHEWECVGMSTAGSDYRCKKCYAYKFEPYTSNITSDYIKQIF